MTINERILQCVAGQSTWPRQKNERAYHHSETSLGLKKTNDGVTRVPKEIGDLASVTLSDELHQSMNLAIKGSWNTIYPLQFKERGFANRKLIIALSRFLWGIFEIGIWQPESLLQSFLFHISNIIQVNRENFLFWTFSSIFASNPTARMATALFVGSISLEIFSPFSGT